MLDDNKVLHDDVENILHPAAKPAAEPAVTKVAEPTRASDAEIVTDTEPAPVPEMVTLGVFSAEEIARFEREAQLLPPEEVMLPGGQGTLADLRRRQAEADQRELTSPEAIKARDFAERRFIEQSSAYKLPDSTVHVTPEGQIISAPVTVETDSTPQAPGVAGQPGEVESQG